VNLAPILILVSTTVGFLPAAGLSRNPVLLELFTSEGCSSCPPADRLLQVLDQTQPIDNAELVVLSEHVDYWNSLGWKDRFSSSALTERQSNYASQLHLAAVYTPQLIIDGRLEVVGSNAANVRASILAAARDEKAPLQIEAVESQGKKMRIRISVERWPAGENGHALLLLAVASNQMESHVSAGENAGKQLTHVAVVRSLQSLGEVGLATPLNREVTIPVNPAEKGSVRIVAFIQDSKSQRVLAVAQLRPGDDH
jgi:hypothetical protein